MVVVFCVRRSEEEARGRRGRKKRCVHGEVSGWVHVVWSMVVNGGDAVHIVVLLPGLGLLSLLLVPMFVYHSLST